MWAGGKLKPFQLVTRRYQWILFPINLQPGYYRIALTLTSIPQDKTVTAYAIAFLPGEKDLNKYPLSSIGFGFHMTPAIAARDLFETHRNVTNFETTASGIYNIAVTTRDWSAEVEKVTFEVALFKSKMGFLYKSYIP